MRSQIMLVAAILYAALPGLAVSQDNDESRNGFRYNSFRIQPVLSLGLENDTNIFRENVNQNNAFLLKFAPRLSIASDWNRHGLRLSLGSEYGYRADDSDDNYFDYRADLSGVLDVTRAVRLSGSIGYINGHEDRGTDDVAATLRATEPTSFDTLYLNALAEAAFGRFTFAPFFNGRMRNFTDVALQSGGFLNNDDRDRTEIETGLEISYDVRGGFSAFVKPSYIDVDYDDPVDDGGVNRDASGFRVLTGVKVDLTRLLEASFGVGYQSYNYKSAALSDFSGLAVDARGVWSVTPRLQLVFSASRAVVETTVGGASAAIQLGGQVGAEYDLLRTVVLKADAGFINVEYEGAARTDNLFSAGFGVDWRVTRSLTLSSYYDFNLRDTSAVGLGYRAHEIGVDAKYSF